MTTLQPGQKLYRVEWRNGAPVVAKWAVKPRLQSDIGRIWATTPAEAIRIARETARREVNEAQARLDALGRMES